MGNWASVPAVPIINASPISIPANFTAIAIIGVNNATISVANSENFFLKLLFSVELYVSSKLFGLLLFFASAFCSCVVSLAGSSSVDVPSVDAPSAYAVFVVSAIIEITGKICAKTNTPIKSVIIFLPIFLSIFLTNAVRVNICMKFIYIFVFVLSLSEYYIINRVKVPN